MPRRPRRLSPTDIYHIVVRGLNKAVLFPSPADYSFFLTALGKILKDGEFDLYAYCLMNNHVHLLLKAESQYLERTMKRLLVVYANYYNKKLQRIGPVFQDRFRSEPIDSQRYFMACARYIHNNPVKAGIVSAPQAYPWSSYREYIAPGQKSLVNRRPLYDCFAPQTADAVKLLVQFTGQDSDLTFLDVTDQKQVVATIQEILKEHGLARPEELRLLPAARRNILIRKVFAAANVSRRELARLLGLNKQMVYNALPTGQKEPSPVSETGQKEPSPLSS